MFKLNKKVTTMDKNLDSAFGLIGKDMSDIMYTVEDLANRVDSLTYQLQRADKVITSLVKDRNRFTKVGPQTGKTYMTLAGKVNALATAAGVTFEVTPAVKVPATINVVKVKKAKKAGK